MAEWQLVAGHDGQTAHGGRAEAVQQLVLWKMVLQGPFGPSC